MRCSPLVTRNTCMPIRLAARSANCASSCGKPRGMGALAFIGAKHDDRRRGGGFGRLRIFLHGKTPGVKKRSQNGPLGSSRICRGAAAAPRGGSRVRRHKSPSAPPGAGHRPDNACLAGANALVNTVLYQTIFRGIRAQPAPAGQKVCRQPYRSSICLPLQMFRPPSAQNSQIATCTNRGKYAGNVGL